mmetsp:Transcript_117857/g.234799  ORF Transcript_117857/g.234799 Transcript_117857/m.234799 type:complete len:330 (+) Transcript_117857:48-1037(+)
MVTCCWKQSSRRTACDVTDEDSPSRRVENKGTGAYMAPEKAQSSFSLGGLSPSSGARRKSTATRKSTASIGSVKSFASFSHFMYSHTLGTVTLFGYSNRQLRKAYDSKTMLAKVDLNKFLRENLVPVQGFACRAPADPNREPALKALTYKLNDSLRTKGCVDRRLRVPPEAFCRVSLDTVGEFDGNANLLADRAQLVRLGFKVHGKLLFPPDDPRHDRELHSSRDAAKQALERRIQVTNTPRGRSNGRWHLGFEVRIVLERSAEDVHAEDAIVPALQVKAVDIDLANTGKEGDAMADSWLPKGDILTEIEGLIDDKLQEAIAEATGECG